MLWTSFSTKLSEMDNQDFLGFMFWIGVLVVVFSFLVPDDYFWFVLIPGVAMMVPYTVFYISKLLKSRRVDVSERDD